MGAMYYLRYFSNLIWILLASWGSMQLFVLIYRAIIGDCYGSHQRAGYR